MDAFRQELSKLGWIDGKNITIEYRFAEEKLERTPELAADLVRKRVDLIVVAGVQSAAAAKKATTTIPIVIASAADPVSSGLIASLARPGGNITGNSTPNPELNTKRLEVLKDTAPKLVRVGILFATPERQGFQQTQLEDLRAAAQALKLKLEEIDPQTRRQRFRERFSNRKEKAGGRDNDVLRSPPFRPKKAHRRACRETSLACYLRSEGVCRCGRLDVLRGGLRRPFIVARRFTWTRS